MAQQNRVWFITGTSRGFGRIWTEAALERGDRVVATARKLESISDFKEKYGDQVLTLELDVTNPEQVTEAVKKGHEYFGKLDIVLNNAGYSLVGTIEEGAADEIRTLYETNIIGPIRVIQAALPILREQGFGHILGTSSTIGHFTSPFLGYYGSSKWAFEAIHESLSEEVKQFGIKVTIIEPGAYATEFGSQDSMKFTGNIEAYKDLKAEFIESLSSFELGDPNATAQALFKIVDSENPPLRFHMGSHNLPVIKGIYAERIALWESWDEVSRSAQGN